MSERAYHECPIADEYLLVLDGRVVELFHLRKGDQGQSWRWHVSTLGIDGRTKRDGRVALQIGDRNADGNLRRTAVVMTVDAEDMARVTEFLGHTLAVRDEG